MRFFYKFGSMLLKTANFSPNFYFFLCKLSFTVKRKGNVLRRGRLYDWLFVWNYVQRQIVVYLQFEYLFVSIVVALWIVVC